MVFISLIIKAGNSTIGPEEQYRTCGGTCNNIDNNKDSIIHSGRDNVAIYLNIVNLYHVYFVNSVLLNINTRLSNMHKIIYTSPKLLSRLSAI